jgi:hypothetical protein
MKRWQMVAGGVGLVAVVIVALVLTPKAARLATGGAATPMDVVAPQAVAEWAAPAAPLARAAAAPAGAGGGPGVTLPSAGDLAAQQAADTLRMLIRTGQVTMQVDSLEPAVAEVKRIATGAGGYVANASQTTTEHVRSATIEIKVPAQRFDRLFEGLRAVGDVEVANVTAQDVGEEYTDVAARMANARRLETRLLELLATRTGRLQDVLEVERELARVREEIERYAGRLQYLRQHAAVSTITVELHEPGTIIGERPGAGVIGRAFLQAWSNFVYLLAWVIQALGVMVPLGLAAWLGWKAWVRWRRREAGK